MKRLMTGLFLVTCVLPLIGWGSSYGNKNDKEAQRVGENLSARNAGDKEADSDRQGNDETIKRSQGDESGLRDVKREGPLQNDERGRF